MMDIWYRAVEVLPFDWAGHGEMLFMKNALLAILLLSPVFGILGTMVVNNRMAFFSDALGHGAFTGVVVGGLMGFMKPVYSAVLFSILFSVAITIIKDKTRISSDTVIGVFSSVAIALGIFIITAGGRSFAKLNTYLIGDILSITPGEIALLAYVLVAVLILWFLYFNKLLLMSVNTSLAASRGLKTFWIEILFTTSIAVIVTVSMSWIGLLVINSMLVLPAAAARNVTVNVRQYHRATVLFSLFSGVLGLLFSYSWGTATGATIVLILSAIFFITFALRGRFS